MLARMENKKLFSENNLSLSSWNRKIQSDNNSKYVLCDNFGNSSSNFTDRKDFTQSNITHYSNNFNSLDKIAKNNSLTFEQYTSVINNTMSRYEVNKTKDDSFDEVVKPIKPKDIKRYHRVSQSHQNINKHVAFLPIITERSEIKVSAHLQEFENPYRSYEVLRNNKEVFCEIKRTNFDRQEILYREALEKIKKDNFNSIEKIPRIKIIDIYNRKVPNEIDEVRKSPEILNINFYDEEKITGNKKNKMGNYLSLPLLKAQGQEFHSFYKRVGKSFPEVCDQFTFHGDASSICLWGGLNSNKSNFMWSLNSETLEWTKHIPKNIAPFQRYGHTGLLYLRNLLIIGGRTKENNYTSFPSQVEIYNIDHHTWSTHSIFPQASNIQRRNHIAEIIGNQMIIHGGITENNEYLNDTLLINISPLKFAQCEIKEDTPWPCLAGHACALVVPSEIRNNVKFHIYKNIEGGFPKKSHLAVRIFIYV